MTHDEQWHWSEQRAADQVGDIDLVVRQRGALFIGIATIRPARVSASEMDLEMPKVEDDAALVEPVGLTSSTSRGARRALIWSADESGHRR
jgi:hypothetical protein